MDEMLRLARMHANDRIRDARRERLAAEARHAARTERTLARGPGDPGRARVDHGDDGMVTGT